MGQNFLVQENIARRIITEAHLISDDEVLEIGPGHGELTARYANLVRRAVLIEYDPKLARRLKTQWSGKPSLVCICEDARLADFQKMGWTGRPVVLANLPYYASKPIIGRLLDWNGYSRAVVMVQEEVGRRLLAHAGAREYSLSSVIFQLSAEGKFLFKVPPEAFRPAPKVSSVVLRFCPLAKTYSREPTAYYSFIRGCFASRRQKLSNNLTRFLGAGRSEIEATLARAGVDPGARAQEIPVEKFLALAKFFEKRGSVI